MGLFVDTYRGTCSISWPKNAEHRYQWLIQAGEAKSVTGLNT